MARAPLAGVCIVDLTELLPGPYATQLLGDLGADVIKIERPGIGDAGRAMSAGLFAAVNRGKRSVHLDLKQKDGAAILRKLVKRADVFVEGYRPGVAKRLGIDYETLRQVNSRLVYASLTGYGQTGPLAQRAGHDIDFLAAAGVIAVSGDPDGPPVYDIGVPVGDLAGAMFAAVAILGALIQVKHTAEGQYLDVSFTDGLVSWMSARIGVHLASAEKQGASTKKQVLTRPAYGVFEAADGKHLTIGALETLFWRRLIQALGLTMLARPELDDYRVRVKFIGEITAELTACFRSRPLAHWVRVLTEHDIPFSSVLNLTDVLNDPHFRARGLFVDAEGGPFVRFPIPMMGLKGTTCRAPQLGEHTDDVLGEIGIDPSEIEVLRSRAAI